MRYCVDYLQNILFLLLNQVFYLYIYHIILIIFIHVLVYMYVNNFENRKILIIKKAID